MDAIELTVGILIAIVLIAAAAYFAYRQRVTLQFLRSDPQIPPDQGRHLFKQCWCRLFGSLVLFVLAGMIVGSLFLDYDLIRQPFDQLPPAEQEAAKNAFRLISVYWMSLLLLLMAVMALAVFDLWATARFGVQLQKQLIQEHQEMLAA